MYSISSTQWRIYNLNSQTAYPVVDYISIQDKTTQNSVIKITADPKYFANGYYYQSKTKNYGLGGLALYYTSGRGNKTAKHTISTHDGQPIAKLILGSGVIGATEDNGYLFTQTMCDNGDIVASVPGKWSFDADNHHLIFTPDTPVTEFSITPKSSVTKWISIGYFGVVRNVKAPAPTLSDEIMNSKTFPMMVDGEYHYLDGMPSISVKGTQGEKYVYSINNSLTEDDLTSTSTEMFGTEIDGVYQFSAMIMDNIPLGESKVLHCAQVEDDGSLGEVLHLPICHVAIPTVNYNDGTFETMAEKGEIVIEKPTGVEKVFYSFLDDDPTTKGTELPADGKITLPSLETGSTIKLNLVAKCGDTFGEVTTVKCKRVALAKPVVVGYTEDFTPVGLYGDEVKLDGFKPSSIAKLSSDEITIFENKLILALGSEYSFLEGENNPFIEVSISSSPEPDANNGWMTANTYITDGRQYLLLCETIEPDYNNAPVDINLPEGKDLISTSQTSCYLHLRSASIKRPLFGSPDPEKYVTSEVTTLHIVKAKPAKPAIPVVTEWTESFYYNQINKEVEPSSMNALSGYSEPVISGTQLLLALGSHYGSTGEPLLQYQLSTTPEPDAGALWRTCDTGLKSTSQYNGKDLLLFQRENSININGFLFPSDNEGRRPADIYLHLRAVTTSDEDAYDFVASEPTSIYLHHTMPTAPAINTTSPGETKGTVTRFVNSISVKPEKNAWEGSQQLQYAFVKAEGAVWPGQQPEQWTDATDGFVMNVECDGRMYARIWDPVYNQASATTVMDFELIEARRIKAEEWTSTDANALVQIDEPMKIMGCYMTRTAATDGAMTAYTYLIDADGNTLKMVISGEEAPLKTKLNGLKYLQFANGAQHPGQELVIPAGSIIARLSKTVTNDGEGLMPEILVTPTAGESYLAYLGGAEWDAFATTAEYAAKQEPEVRTSIDVKADFARKVSLRSLAWLGSANKVRTADGMELTLYNRLDVSSTGYKFDDDINALVKDNLYKVTGYVGQLNGELALFPTEATLQCPGTPVLYAPNLVSGEAEADGFIKVNAISEEVAFTIESQAGASTTFLFKTAASSDFSNAQMQPAPDGRFTLPLTVGKQYLAVYAEINGMRSLQPAKVEITRHEADEVKSIAEFKQAEIDRRAEAGYDGSEHYYRLKGQAVIRKITDYYLYVSDCNNAAATDPAMKYLLIYNENGWSNPQFNDGTKIRGLLPGDIIENFALVGHDGMKLSGNIISNSSGYARTFKYAGKATDQDDFKPEVIDVNYVDVSSDSHYSKVAFGEDQRMTYVELRNVRVKRTGTDESDYAYTLDIKNEPALTFDVFPRTQGWHTMWKEDESFTISGVVVRDDKPDGTVGYAFAPTAFTAANSLTGELSISFDGDGEVIDGLQHFVQGKAVINYAPAQSETVAIYYTTDGTDPRNNVEGRTRVDGSKAEIELTDDAVIRAFAAAPGLNPTEEKSMTFRNAVSEVQYILNFLRAGREGMTYRFTSKLQIVAAGGDYLFVAGPVGHFLPVYREGGWDTDKYQAGSYLQHLLAMKSTDANGNIMADASKYDTPAAIAPDDIAQGEQITVKPDQVNALTAASARRLVTVSNVTAKAVTARAAGAPFTITTLDGSQSHPLMSGNLGDVKIQETDAQGNLTDTDLDFADGEAYDITGFVMLGEAAGVADEPEVELWPVSAIHLVRTPAVSVDVQGALTMTETSENEYLARFTDMTAVSFSADNVRDARIYYSFDNEEWFEYFKPIAVDASCMIHAKAAAPGMTESVHTHLTLEKVTVSGDIEFTATPAPEGGKVSVALRPSADLAEGSYAIRYTTDGTNPTTASALYSAPFDLTESATVKAILIENGCEPGAIARAYITVPAAQPEQPSEPDPTVSGRVKFSLDDSDPAKVLVKIEPDGAAAPGYEIYYTTDAGKTFPDGWTKYDKPFDVTESTLVMAVLVENGKKPGVVAEVSVWVNPGITGIDGIGEDEADNAVRAEGDSIVAPAGSRIYDISGRQVRPEGLRKGIYIVVIPDGSSTKVLVK